MYCPPLIAYRLCSVVASAVVCSVSTSIQWSPMLSLDCYLVNFATIIINHVSCYCHSICLNIVCTVVSEKSSSWYCSLSTVVIVEVEQLPFRYSEIVVRHHLCTVTLILHFLLCIDACIVIIVVLYSLYCCHVCIVMMLILFYCRHLTTIVILL